MTKVAEFMDGLHLNVEKTFVPNPPAYLSDSAYQGGDEGTDGGTWYFQTAITVPMRGICMSYATLEKPDNYLVVKWPHDEYCVWQASFQVNAYLEAVTLHVRVDQQYEAYCFEQHLDPSLLTSWRNFNFHKEHARIWSELLAGGKFRNFTELSENSPDFSYYDGPETDSTK